jgi:hypothetical protein
LSVFTKGLHLMRGPRAFWIGMALTAFASGCRSCDRVESALRARETDVRELREELERSELYNQALQQELRMMRGETCPQPAEQPCVGYPVRSLTLGRQTGGRDTDCGDGDNALQVVMEPRDPEGQAIKAPGTALIQALEITSEGLKRPLSAWEISAEQLRQSWRSGLLTTGYVVTLRWKICPATEKMRIVAQLRLTDGRVFEADKDVTIRLPPAQKRSVTQPMPPADPAPATPQEKSTLPPPKPVDPPDSGPSIDQPAQGTTIQKDRLAPTVWRAVRPPSAVPAAQILRPVLTSDK